jgi:hypothetical protein
LYEMHARQWEDATQTLKAYDNQFK